MNRKKTTGRSVKWLFSLRRYIIFFFLMAFVITCCMTLFLNMMTRSTGLVLTQNHIEQAAKVTFLNVVLLTGAKDCESSGADHERQFFGADPAY